MSQITRNSLLAPAFFALSASREARSELIDDQTVMTASTTLRHWGLVANIQASLHGQLRGTGCQPTCSKTGVQTKETTIRTWSWTVDPERIRICARPAWFSCLRSCRPRHIEDVRASQLVSPTTLLLCERHQGADRPALIDVGINFLTTSCPDPPPDPDQARAPKKITLNSHAVEAVHVQSRVDPSQVQVCRKDFKLGTAVQHGNLRLSFR